MKARFSIALVTALIALSNAAPVPSGAGSCRHTSAQNCFSLPAKLDFSSVPEISNEIVSGEPDVGHPQKSGIDPQPAAQPYTGPMIGVNSHVGAPTIGYYWSIQ
jgi:hypothetical protein